jgi:hypothetical protein
METVTVSKIQQVLHRVERVLCSEKGTIYGKFRPKKSSKKCD